MAFARGGPGAVCVCPWHPRGPGHSAVPAMPVPQPDSTGVFIKITVYFVPSGSDFNLSVL